MNIGPEKIQACMGFEPMISAIPCSAVLYQLSEQANWELVIMLASNKPVK